ncbi:MAG: hypothetical protein AB1498_12395 [bacterium]
MTLVNFKNYEYPSDKKVYQFKKIVPQIISEVIPILHEVRPFKIYVGKPKLFKNAAILEILNESGEIKKIRDDAYKILNQELSIELAPLPKRIHCTILRFKNCPDNIQTFTKKFQSLTDNFYLGESIIDEILLTAEKKPYMIAGEILYRFSLRKN